MATLRLRRRRRTVGDGFADQIGVNAGLNRVEDVLLGEF
jgi:hypothetical protein